MTKKEYDEKHQEVIKQANAYRDEYLKIPFIERWMESVDGATRFDYRSKVQAMHTAAAELWWIKQNDLIWIPDPDPQKDIHMQKGNVIRMIKYFRQHYEEIEMASNGVVGLIERCINVAAAITEDDSNDRVWTEYHRLIAPKEKHDPDKSKLYAYIRPEYHRDFDYLWDRIIQIMKFNADDLTLARIACAMYESNMTTYHEHQRKWSKWYRAFCEALAIDCAEMYQDHRPQLKNGDAYFKIVNAIHSYLPNGYADRNVANLSNIDAIIMNPLLTESQRMDEWNKYLQSQPDHRIGTSQKGRINRKVQADEQYRSSEDDHDSRVDPKSMHDLIEESGGYSKSDNTWEKIEKGDI